MRALRPEPAAAAGHHSDDPFESAQGKGPPEAGLDHETGPPTFLFVGELVGENAREGLGRHAGPREHARPLQESRRAHHHDGIALRGEPDLEQQRDVEHHQPLAPRGGAAQVSALNLPHPGVDDGLQPAQRGGVAEHAFAQHRPVDRTVPDRPGKGGCHVGDCRPALRQQAMHGGIGIVDRHAEFAEHIRRRRLPHADGTGEPDDHHVRQSRRSAATCLRSASSTAGSAPYQPAKPGRAWWSSISSPSTARNPRARAEASSPVSSGV